MPHLAIKSICAQGTAPHNRQETKHAGKWLKQENTQRRDDRVICVQLAVYSNCPSCQVGRTARDKRSIKNTILSGLDFMFLPWTKRTEATIQ